jgi:ligand-binding sensor domain-containing protein
MKILRKILLIMMLALPLAAAGVYLFKTLDARSGLTISQINCILKDSRGYVWLGTPAGLYRYDGYTFHNFQCNSQDGSSLPDSYIISIQETLEGTLWIKTSAGFCIYHPQTESFERDMKQVYGRMGIEGSPSVVYIDSHKNFWAAIPNKGVVAYNMHSSCSLNLAILTTTVVFRRV